MIRVSFKKADGSNRSKSIADEQLNEYLSYGWIIDNGEAVEIPLSPIVDTTQYGRIVAVNPEPIAVSVEPSPLERLTKAVDKHIDAPKRKAGRPPKKRR